MAYSDPMIERLLVAAAPALGVLSPLPGLPAVDSDPVPVLRRVRPVLKAGVFHSVIAG